MTETADVDSLLAPYRCVITYEPLRTEVPWDDLLDLSNHTICVIPPRPARDPATEALRVRKCAGDEPTALLIPGRAFDATGTRHGQGGGWYDRFLKEVPREWLRIGLCYAHQFSQSPLLRQSWDEPMDHVLVVSRETGASTLYSSAGEPL